jgi:RND superfamily putative drug exporter
VFRGRIARRGPSGLWARIAGAVTGHPRASLITSVCVLGALAVPVLSMRTADPRETDLPANTPVLVAEHAIEHAFPGSPITAHLVVTGRHLDAPSAVAGLRALGQRAITVTHGRGDIRLQVAHDGNTAVLSVPLPNRGVTDTGKTVAALRQHVDPLAPRLVAGTRAQMTGDAAANLDVTNRLSQVTPIVIGFVLALAFVLLVAAFRSPLLAASVIALNLLSVGAAFGAVVAVFQHHWAESLLGFQSNGAIVMWLPLFAFVVLFGLSMDYTVLMLERVREARRGGADARTAASQALTSTGGTVTSAALVMIAVFAVFATLRLLEFKQLGVGLAAAIALDATIVRGVALPAVVTLLGERGVRRARTRARAWDHGPQVAALGTSND